MYTSIYIHRVDMEHVGTLLKILSDAAEVYVKHGALGCELFRQADLTGKYGCSSFAHRFHISGDEEIVIEMNHFRDEEHHRDTMSKIDRDQRIAELYEALQDITSVADIIRGEFTKESERT